MGLMPERLIQPVPLVLAALAAVLIIAAILARIAGGRVRLVSCLDYGAYVMLILLTSEAISFGVSCWLWGALSFYVLKEYFSLIDIRLQDRYAVWVAYISIPFMLHYAAIDWYNMFIISIPVYSFLVIPFVVSLGGSKAEGSIYSVGAICFGLFLFVYCVGHLAYLSRYSSAIAGAVVFGIVLSDMVLRQLAAREVRGFRYFLAGYALPAPLTGLLLWAVSKWLGVSGHYPAILGLMIPALVIVGNHTVEHIGADLGISGPDAPPGKGGIIENVKPLLFAAPIALHYYRYFVL